MGDISDANDVTDGAITLQHYWPATVRQGALNVIWVCD